MTKINPQIYQTINNQIRKIIMTGDVANIFPTTIRMIPIMINADIIFDAQIDLVSQKLAVQGLSMSINKR